MGGKRKLWTLFVFLLLTGPLVYLLWWRLQVSQIRFFDADEFSYLHWAAQVARGDRMYIDFVSYFTPGFMWVFAPIFWIYGVSSDVLIAGRIISYTIFLGILGSLGCIFGLTRGWKWALLPVVILSFLPMPYDKFLEIRPDNLATLLVLVGVIIQVVAIRRDASKWWLISGIAYSASLFVLAKTLPIVAVGGAIALLYGFGDKKSFAPSKILSSSLVHFLLGLLGPWILFFACYAISGHFHVVWYSLTKLVFESAIGAKIYMMVPTLFFYPNAAFYGGNGSTITSGLLTNHALWLLAIFVGAYRLITPFHEGNREKTLIELLATGAFFISVIAYVKFFPLKHSQYLIPIAVFVAYYAADGLSLFFEWLRRVGGYASLLVVLLGFAYLLVDVTQQVNAPKLLNTNTLQVRELASLIQTVPRSSRVVDLEGKMFFWREGYPICCIPFDIGLPYETEKPLPLAAYLSHTPADYIYTGEGDRLITLFAANTEYLRTHFAPVPGFGERLWKRLP